MSPSYTTDSYRCTASNLATFDLYEVDAKDTSQAVHDDLAEREYDVAPVVQNSEPYGFVKRIDLEDAPDESPVKDHATTVELEHLIAPDAEFETVLEALYERPRYFIASQDEISGILTRADLNSQPARLHMFTHISLFEQTARDLIKSKVPNWWEQTHLKTAVKDDIKSNQEKARENNVDLPAIHYAQLSTINKVLTSHEQCWRELGFDTDHEASPWLHDVKELRNDVAHSNPIIQNTERGLTEEGRTITELLDTYQFIRKVTEQTVINTKTERTDTKTR